MEAGCLKGRERVCSLIRNPLSLQVCGDFKRLVLKVRCLDQQWAAFPGNLLEMQILTNSQIPPQAHLSEALGVGPSSLAGVTVSEPKASEKPCDEGIHQAKGQRALRSLAEGQREALEVSLTLVTSRSVFVAVRAELTPGALEAIAANARSVAAETVCALGAKTGPVGCQDITCPSPKGSQTLSLHDLTSWNSDSSPLEMTLWDSLGLMLVSGRKLR